MASPANYFPAEIRFPPEIRHMIVNSIHYNSSDVVNPHSHLILDFLSCCIASKQWRDTTIPFLANNFELLNFDNWPDDILVLKLAQRISQLVNVSPQALMCCVKVKLKTSVTDYGFRHSVIFDESVIDIIHMLPGLKVLGIFISRFNSMMLADRIWEIRDYLARIQAAAQNKVTELIFELSGSCYDKSSVYETLFAAMPKLRKVQVCLSAFVNDLAISRAFSALSKGSPHIEVLELSLPFGNFSFLDNLVGKWSELRVLNITSKCERQEHVGTDLLHKLEENCPKLEEFMIPRYPYNGDQCNWRSWEDSLISMFKCCPNIRKLDLSYRDLNDTTLTFLATEMLMLENLTLRKCFKMPYKALIASSLIKINLPRLQRLNLRGCLDVNIIQALASSAPSLEILDISSCLNDCNGLVAYLETTLDLIKEQGKHPIDTRWVKKNAQERRNA